MTRDIYTDNPNLRGLLLALILTMLLWISYFALSPWTVLILFLLGGLTSYGLGAYYLNRHTRDVTENDRIARNQIQATIDGAENYWDSVNAAGDISPPPDPPASDKDRFNYGLPKGVVLSRSGREFLARHNAALRAAGRCYYAEDGTLMSPNGKRSVFDDVDQ